MDTKAQKGTPDSMTGTSDWAELVSWIWTQDWSSQASNHTMSADILLFCTIVLLLEECILADSAWICKGPHREVGLQRNRLICISFICCLFLVKFLLAQRLELLLFGSSFCLFWVILAKFREWYDFGRSWSWCLFWPWWFSCHLQ